MSSKHNLVDSESTDLECVLLARFQPNDTGSVCVPKEPAMVHWVPKLYRVLRIYIHTYIYMHIHICIYKFSSITLSLSTLF